MTERSQVACIGLPHPQSWEEYREGCLGTYGGGHNSDGHLKAFRHGMETVFNLLEAEFPRAEVCKAAPELVEAVQYAIDCIDGKIRDYKDQLPRKLRAALKLAEGK